MDKMSALMQGLRDKPLTEIAGHKMCIRDRFSGGMRQRCVMAIALAADPDILFADEPTTEMCIRDRSWREGQS